ncbi:putative 2'-deoxynucleoside 5'-phosphate N-hydrolase 1 [Chionoecetes opilio]|uniref:Putative 2'-deoxynucleoside 5'-phosphate N-hydrolase 1 n=1 Tax=Chionoecetes opilio TaxID=41210 RepID=A0A8J4XS39_CHIOP|nr:putative 2'-deoxynucleoside 5'-phosphate N-hydrolase 1 [Chionoecetes opilio]
MGREVPARRGPGDRDGTRSKITGLVLELSGYSHTLGAPECVSIMPSKLKIYFCGSIRAGRGDVDLYGRIVEMLGAYGKVLTPFVADKAVMGTSPEEGTARGDKEIYDRDMELMGECHAVVAEVTQPSLGVGYELGQGSAMGKTILCLYRPQQDKLLSAMIRGAEQKGKFITRDYKEEELPKIFEEFFTECVAIKHKDSLDWDTYEPIAQHPRLSVTAGAFNGFGMYTSTNNELLAVVHSVVLIPQLL